MSTAVQPAPGADLIQFDVEQVEALMLRMPNQIECPVEHIFAPGVYCRKLTMPAGSIVLGHEHLTEHLNIATRGRAIVLIDGVRKRITAPFTCVSAPGSRKIAYVLEEMEWLTIHPTTETDVEKLEAMLIRQSPTFIAAHEVKELVAANEKEESK